MVDLTDFFKVQKGPKAAKPVKRKVEQSPKTVSEAPAAKKSKTAPIAISSSAEARPAQKKKRVVISDDDFDDDDFKMDESEAADEELDEPEILDDDDDFVELVKPPKSSRRESKPVVATPSPVKKSPVKKSPVKKETPKKPESTSKPALGGTTAEELLKTIPDAVLPDTSETEGLSFFQLKQRQAEAPQPDLGSREIPEGSPNCLAGLTIVFTGNLPSLDRSTSESLATRYGAKVTKSLSKKTSLVVIGAEAGPSKVKKIKEFGIKAIDEDGFVSLISGVSSNGGGSEAAAKAIAKKEEEEKKAIAEAEKEMKEEENREKERLQKLAQRSAQSGSSSSKDSLPIIIKTSDKPDSEKLWTVKYAPTKMEHICGNKSNVAKLSNWLTNWFANSKAGFKNPGKDGTGVFRAVLISGPPGIGKTTAAHVVAKSLGFDVLEKNASDVRSKSLLNADLKSVLDNTSLVGFFQGKENHNANQNKFVLIMDEVDGMSSGDHGGVGQLAAFCRQTSMPLILICNDKSLPKMRPFDRVTLDLTWRRPSAQEMRSRLMTIAHREKFQLDPNVIDQLVETTHNDIRQIINILSQVSRTQKKLGFEDASAIKKAWQKQVSLKPFDIIGRLLSGSTFSESSHMSLNDKLNLYFDDIDFTPLMVQENYLSTAPSRLSRGSPKDQNLSKLELLEKASNAISESDLVNSKIRSGEQQWSLLPFHGLVSSVLPSSYVAGQIQSRINFTAWLGQNSKRMKFSRLLQELQYRTSIRTSTNNVELRLSYMTYLIQRLFQPLVSKQQEGISDVIEIMDCYFLTKEDWDNIMDFGVGRFKMEANLKKIPTPVKTAFTRKYNGMTHPISIYKTGNSVASGGGKKVVADSEDVVVDDMNDKADEDDDEDNSLKKDKLIKEVKKKAGGKAKAKGKAASKAKAKA
ncbi:unnamed protein product [Kuraishia capsulata CBS 1993]|uniref:Replication factor C subunit 1 n=1 Tax=Kuraishia capsulata CBS 1993 TaxID=1382522 RepID=W6MX49_9ASCO|nr:uncharacterized protein KUCA_T00004252001 [Kuraishia capsulata CBS 1993]CDK28270.1 unnamed protein product [Kuraishia capsulata CBS 1993]